MSPADDPAGSWAAADLVDRWIAGDAMAPILDLPRRLTAALVRASGVDVRRVVDVGAGPGAFLRTMLEEFPEARGVWVDASRAMLERAEASLADLGGRVSFHLGDVRAPDALPLAGEVILSSRALHHFRPETIERLYRSAFDGLGPGGFLANLDHVAPPGDWRARYEAVRPRFVRSTGGEREPGGERHSHDAPPQPIEDHLTWLRRAGFADPDVPWRMLWTALIVARRPA